MSIQVAAISSVDFKKISVRAGISLAFATIAACSSDPNRYVPAEHRATKPQEAIYKEPSDKPTGTIRIQAIGIEDVKHKTAENKDSEIPALHLRMLVSNHAPTGNWVVDTQDISVSFVDGEQAKPIFSNPVKLIVRPGELLSTDVFVPLPKNVKSSDDLPAFDLRWKAQAGNQVVAESTPFDRVKIETYYANNYPYWGGPYGPYYGSSIGFGWGW
jgi:hypothetical protein